MPTAPASDEVRQVVVHSAVWPHLVAWLAGRGIGLGHLPLEGDDLPTYIMTLADTPSEEVAAVTEPTPARDDIRQQAERVRESQRQVGGLLDQYAPLTPRQDAAVRPLETPAGVDAGMEMPESATGVQAGAQRPSRMTATTATDDGLDALYDQLEIAQALLGQISRQLDEARADHREERAVRRWIKDENTRLRSERDRARRIAVALEQELARATAQITAN